MSTKNKSKISIATVKRITNEELRNYVNEKLTENNLRETIREQLDNTGKGIVFEYLGLRWDSFGHKWSMSSYGNFENILRKQKSLIEDTGIKVMCELIKEVTPQDVLKSLTQKNKNDLKKIYDGVLMNTFESEIRKLADEHGKKYAQELFKQYLSESEESENKKE